MSERVDPGRVFVGLAMFGCIVVLLGIALYVSGLMGG